MAIFGAVILITKLEPRPLTDNLLFGLIVLIFALICWTTSGVYENKEELDQLRAEKAIKDHRFDLWNNQLLSVFSVLPEHLETPCFCFQSNGWCSQDQPFHACPCLRYDPDKIRWEP